MSSFYFSSGVNPGYNCESYSVNIASVQWLINGTRLEDLSLTNVATIFVELTRQGSLLFNNVSVEYNNTNIQCRATLSNGETADSNNVTLFVEEGERKIIIKKWRPRNSQKWSEAQ